jgi:hypothetical protein
VKNEKTLYYEQHEKILETLKTRFEKNMNWHITLEWVNIKLKLKTNLEKLWSLNEIEQTDGEPDVVVCDKNQMHTYCMIFFHLLSVMVRTGSISLYSISRISSPFRWCNLLFTIIPVTVSFPFCFFTMIFLSVILIFNIVPLCKILN